MRANGCSLRRLTIASKPRPASSEADTSTESDVVERHQLECCMMHIPRCRSVCGRHYDEAKSFICCRDSGLDLRVTSSESRQTHDCPYSVAREHSSHGDGSSASKNLPLNSALRNRVLNSQIFDSACHCSRHLSVQSSCTVRERVLKRLDPCCASPPSENISCTQNAQLKENHFHRCAEEEKSIRAEKRNQSRRNGDCDHRGNPHFKRLGKTFEKLPKVQEWSIEEAVSTDRMRRRHYHPDCTKRGASSSDLEAQHASSRCQQPDCQRSERLSKILEKKVGQSLKGLRPRTPRICSSGSRHDVDSVLTLLCPQKARVYATERVLEHVTNESRELLARENAVAGHMHFIESPTNQKEEIFLCAETNTTSKLQIPEKFKLLGRKKLCSEKKTRCAISAESEQCLKGVYQRSLATFKMLESKDKKQKNKRFVKPMITKKSGFQASENRNVLHSKNNPLLTVR